MSTTTPEEWIERLDSRDLTVRKRAILAVTRLGEVRALPLLKQIVDHDDAEEVRLLARKALAILQTSIDEAPGAVVALPNDADENQVAGALRATDPSRRYHAVEWIARHSRAQYVPMLVRRIEEEENPQCRALIASTLGALGGRREISSIATLSKDASPQVRLGALVGFIHLNDVAAYPYVIRLLGDSDPAVRGRVLKALARLGRVNLLKICTAMTRHEEGWMQESATFCLAAAKMPEAVPVLEEMLASGKIGVRDKAAAGLSMLARDGVSAARVILETKGMKVAAAVSKELMAVEDLSQKIPTRRLSSKKPEKRLEAIREIVRGQDPEALKVLARQLEVEEDEEVQASLITALGQMRDTGTVTLLERFLTHPTDRIRANAVEAIGTLRPPNRGELLKRSLRDANNRARANAAVALMDVEPAAAEKCIVDLFHHQDVQFRRSAVWAAGVVSQPWCIERLEESMSDTDEIVAARAKEILELLAAEGNEQARQAVESRVEAEVEPTNFALGTTLIEGLNSEMVHQALDEVFSITMSGRIRKRGRTTDKNLLPQTTDPQVGGMAPAASGVRESLADQMPPEQLFPGDTPGQVRVARRLAMGLELAEPIALLDTIAALHMVSPVPGSFGRLRSLAAVDPTREVRAAARELLAQWEKDHADVARYRYPSPSDLDKARRFLSCRGAEERIRFIFLHLARPPVWFPDLLLEMAGSEPDPRVVAMACHGLGEAGNAVVAIPILTRHLQHASPLVVAASIEALERLGAPGVLAKVNETVKNPSNLVQAVALRVMSVYDWDRAISLLQKLATRGERSDRCHALVVLEEMEGPDPSMLAARLLIEETNLDLVEREMAIIETAPTKETCDLVRTALNKAPPDIEPLIAAFKKRLDQKFQDMSLGVNPFNPPPAGMPGRGRKRQTSLGMAADSIVAFMGGKPISRSGIQLAMGAAIGFAIVGLFVVGILLAR